MRLRGNLEINSAVLGNGREDYLTLKTRSPNRGTTRHHWPHDTMHRDHLRGFLA